MTRLVAGLAAQVHGTTLTHGFTRHGSLLEASRGANRELLQLQSSASSTRQSARITVNVGIWSCLVARFNDPGVDGPAHMDDCHWRMRLGEFDEPPSDKW